MTQNVCLRIIGIMMVIGCMCAASPAAMSEDATIASPEQVYAAAKARSEAAKASYAAAKVLYEAAVAEEKAIREAIDRFVRYQGNSLGTEVLGLSMQFPLIGAKLHNAGDDGDQVLRVLLDYRAEALKTAELRARHAAEAAQEQLDAGIAAENERSRMNKNEYDELFKKLKELGV